jgi:hypothetical protein
MNPLASKGADDFYEGSRFRKASLSPVSSKIAYKKLHEVAPSIWVKDNTISLDVCNEIIAKFEASTAKSAGVCGPGVVQEHIKTSVDLMIPNGSVEWRKIDQILFKSLNLAKKEIKKELDKWVRFNDTLFDYDTGYQIQKTTPGGRYVWHCEAEGKHQGDRSLVFTWYLNDVKKGGHTGFARQGVSVQPRPGRLVLFSPYWTHIHAGLPVEEGVKYLITGWIYSS